MTVGVAAIDTADRRRYRGDALPVVPLPLFLVFRPVFFIPSHASVPAHGYTFCTPPAPALPSRLAHRAYSGRGVADDGGVLCLLDGRPRGLFKPLPLLRWPFFCSPATADGRCRALFAFRPFPRRASRAYPPCMSCPPESPSCQLPVTVVLAAIRHGMHARTPPRAHARSPYGWRICPVCGALAARASPARPTAQFQINDIDGCRSGLRNQLRSCHIWLRDADVDASLLECRFDASHDNTGRCEGRRKGVCYTRAICSVAANLASRQGGQDREQTAWMVDISNSFNSGTS
ncbi:hypothetical protein BDY21DRAFT_152098 [Lineolata rhizophorae]|uniref:Uncharacterized protein n=1 Tax=Lineolata rhizophorae TaxID=578093 RepID=A0A6A6NNG4_9PEZI|nr:hypothetical protein BDY21DRAFT_152098 [Lineolata rhizophorae]